MIECLLQQFGFNVQFDSSNQWMVALLEVSILGAIVVAIAVATEQLLRQKVSNKFLYALWMLVLIRFVLIWTPESPTSFLNSIQTTAEPLAAIAATEDFAVPVSAYPIAAVATSTPAEESIVEPFAAAIAVAPAFQEREINWLYVAMAIWLCGCAFLTARLCVGWIKLRQTIARSVDASISAPFLSDLCRELSAESRIRSKVRVLVTDALSTPATTGFFRPVILLPQRCVTELDTDEMRLVLAHELVHIRRCDGIFQLVAWAIQTLHWFNPFVHLAVPKLQTIANSHATKPF